MAPAFARTTKAVSSQLGGVRRVTAVVPAKAGTHAEPLGETQHMPPSFREDNEGIKLSLPVGLRTTAVPAVVPAKAATHAESEVKLSMPLRFPEGDEGLGHTTLLKQAQ